MRLNTDKALALGRQLYQRFGDWDTVRAACVLRDDGVYDATGLLSESPPQGPEVEGQVPGTNPKTAPTNTGEEQ